MKTLFLVRHAKSSRDDPTLPDKERPLNDRGMRDAPRMGERLAAHDVKPDLILSSPAVRALATAQIIGKSSVTRKSILWWTSGCTERRLMIFSTSFTSSGTNQSA